MIAVPPLVDVHNHLIPGVDDGARTLDDALAALAAMRDHGVRRLVATPHLNAELTHHAGPYEARMAEVDAAWARFQAAALEHIPEIEVARGHEIMLDVPRVRLTDPRLRLAGGSAVLVEFPRLFLPAGATQVLHQLRAEGWLPIVAHPERYLNVNLQSGDLSVVEQWRRAGARMAINAGSVLGTFGSGALVTVREMLRCGWVDLIASDFHARSGHPLLLRPCFERLVGWGAAEQAELLLSVNPALAVDGKELLSVPGFPSGAGFWGRVRRMFGR